MFIFFSTTGYVMVWACVQMAFVRVKSSAACPAPMTARIKAALAAIHFVVGVYDAVTGMAVKAAHKFSRFGSSSEKGG